MSALRMGLVGTGPWVRIATAPGMKLAEGVEPVGIWGRDPERTAAAAAEVGLPAFADFDELLAEVDLVGFSVAPLAQGELALHAARAGKHLMLDKPVSLDQQAAEALLAEVTARDLAALVFYTDRFMPTARAWFDEVAATAGWAGGMGHWISALDTTPFGASPWRRREGAFWDLGPHAISMFTAALGPVHELTAIAGAGDVVHLIARHDSGVTSTSTLSQFSSPEQESIDFMVWGQAGFSHKPPREDRADLAYAAALGELAGLIGADAAARRAHPCGLEFGVHQVRLLSGARAHMQRAEEPEGPVGIA